MFAHRSASSPSPCWYVSRNPVGLSGRVRRTRFSSWIYDAILLFVVVLAATQQMLGRGLLLAAFLLCRVALRLHARGRRTPALADRPDGGQLR
ncbi:hypothetical protein [Streptomyces sp. NBC_01506]|uniref:hypothetical protein n=1 Tax=Streptomyces sp. NBC_01506 TaxID=2903887 RepID=UPI003866FCA2